MSDDNKDAELRAYKNDPRTPCQYGIKCYQKNPQHHSKYKHPPKREKMKQNSEKIITGAKRKAFVKDGKKKEARSESPQRKFQKKQESSTRTLYSIFQNRKNTNKNEDKDNNKKLDEKVEVAHKDTATAKNDEDISKKQVGEQAKEVTDEDLPTAENEDKDNEKLNEEAKVTDEDTATAETSSNQCGSSSDSNKTNKIEDVSSLTVAQKIANLFLVEMPKDFFDFYEFCKSISNNNPLAAFKSVQLRLVGPYDVLGNKISCEDEDNKERYLTHWRYYYDPPEFQTILKSDDKDGPHFGYWRDDVTEKPVFVAKNRADVNCVFEPVAENIFGAVDSYLQDKLKSANPFKKTSITHLHSQLKRYAKQHDITLEKNTVNMKLREKRVVARTFHRAGIVVPYDKKTQMGYRDLAATDSDMQKILKKIEEADTPDERKSSMAKLDEIMRLATIAADECDFGTCLELGHDLFSNGGVHVQSRALNMLSIAYTHLQRPQLLKIVEAHLKNRKKGCELSVI